VLKYRIVDVFSERPFEGNGLCVVLDRCPEELMQRIAREVNLSETTFPVQTGEHAYEMRIFTPTGGVVVRRPSLTRHRLADGPGSVDANDVRRNGDRRS